MKTFELILFMIILTANSTFLKLKNHKEILTVNNLDDTYQSPIQKEMVKLKKIIKNNSFSLLLLIIHAYTDAQVTYQKTK
jgi:hypothetical protein